MPERQPHLRNIFQDDGGSSSLSLDTWTQPSGNAELSVREALLPAQTHSWDLADSLMQTLSTIPQLNSPIAAARTLMMQEIQATAARAIMESSSPETVQRAMRLLSGGSCPGSSMPLQGSSQAGLMASSQARHLSGLPLAPPSSSSFSWLSDSSLLGATVLLSQPAMSHASSISLPQAAWHGLPDWQAPFPPLHMPLLTRGFGLIQNFSFSSSSFIPAASMLAPQQACKEFPNRRMQDEGGKTFPGLSSQQPGEELKALPELQQPGTEDATGLQMNPETPPKRLLRRRRLLKRAFPDLAEEPPDHEAPTSHARVQAQEEDQAEEVMDSSDSSEASISCRQSRYWSKKTKKRLKGSMVSQASVQSSSEFRGVSRHRLTQRWEASLWLSGKQLYLGGFDSEEDAAKAYDIAALASKGRAVPTNFGPEAYKVELEQLKHSSKEEIIAYVRRRSSAFSRGRSAFRGVSGQDGRWEARIGSFAGKKNVSFGIHETEEQAARQYDRALVIEKGRAAKTNFPLCDYEQEVRSYKALLKQRHDSLSPAALRAIAATYQLPLELNLPGGGIAQPSAPDRSRGGRPRNSCAAIILAESLRKALSM